MKPSEIFDAISERVRVAPLIKTLSAFDAAIREIEEGWHKATGSAPKLWFRGHENSKWELCPPALRKDRKREGFDHHLFVEFKRRAVGLVDPLPGTDWSWLYVAQHHGLPTRLLDWSESSHVGLFFALCNRDLDDEDPEPPPCVWVLNPGELNRRNWGFESVVTMGPHKKSDPFLNPYLKGQRPVDAKGKEPKPLAVIPEYVSPRIRAQRGAFVAFANDRLALAREAVNGDGEKPTKPPVCVPLVLDRGSLSDIEEELIVAGAGHSAVFPDVTGLCQELARRRSLGRV